MCGVAGIYNIREAGSVLARVKEMGMTMTHRGPDNFGYMERGKIAVAHSRLSLLDLSEAANQPFGNGRYLLTYNGEIYNFKEIKKRLEREHRLVFKTTSDTEVLFHSLIHDGIDECLRHIKGMFAFAFYDEEQDQLILARDRIGIKPLYYYQAGDLLYWASEIKAIVKTLDLTPDPVRTLFATNNMAEKSTKYTLFKEVFSLNPGSYLRLDSRSPPQIVEYYDVVNDFDQELYKEFDRQSGESVLATFEELFLRSCSSGTRIC